VASRIKIGSDRYRVGKATKTVTKADNTKTVSYAKKAGGTVTKSITRSATGTGGYRIGKYARAHATTNDDGSVTYATKKGGTKTVAKSATSDARKKGAKKSKPPATTGDSKDKGKTVDTVIKPKPWQDNEKWRHNKDGA
jgi:hypothetical protein